MNDNKVGTTLNEILIAGGKNDGVSVRGERRVMGRRSGAVIVEVVSLTVVHAVSCLAAAVQSLLLQTL